MKAWTMPMLAGAMADAAFDGVRAARHRLAIGLLHASRHVAPVAVVHYGGRKGRPEVIDARVLGIGTDVMQVAAALVNTGQEIPHSLSGTTNGRHLPDYEALRRLFTFDDSDPIG